ncbi:regulator of G protein signaling superfamily [Pseudovirgaria hyperparasitica]|uniref:Regulator of G protein signaling superfamily n=1 Tax=Pseudovirgaria hyperparasitica TaxID=470096 RepID=A0A6A6WC70_9PEZI|nr:regulator of G protein signaling superfamily [Pseudovirgaria hyperparasitica]KAF2759644.1 regulator of G protein signaling superfamily [Pseudovirgaria hyperparasitica]
MPHRKSNKPSLQIKTISSKSSHSFSTSTAVYESSSEEEETRYKPKMATEYLSTRPLTVSIPRSTSSGPYCTRRPNLSEILANTSQSPYSLADFMAYLSRKHCLETLEFTMDASRYKKHYAKMVNRKPFSSDEGANVKKLWRRLVDAYIAPGGNREVNLPAETRDHLLRQAQADSALPPDPTVLDTAVRMVYELMEESVLVPFLNSQCPASGIQANSSDENLDTSTQQYDAQAYYATAHTQQHVRQTTSQATSIPTHAYNRASAPATYSRSLGPATQHSRFASGPARFASTHSNASGSETLTDDSGSVSPSNDPMTPPTTPPMSEQYGGGWAAELYNSSHPHTTTQTGYISSANSSPRSTRGDHASLANATANQWKRVSSKLGWRKRSGGQLREESEAADRMEE